MTITVTQLNNYIKGVLDIDGVLSNLSVCGEITNVKQNKDGWYFSLKDDNSAINCFCYGDNEPVAGLIAVADGRINYYGKTGSISLFVRRLTVTQDNGSAYARFVALRDKLSKEGLFDQSKKRVVPHCCANIGVVTSETGAVIHDITNVALRRQPFSNIVLYPVKVQGVGADEEIVRGIKYFDDKSVDVIIVGRGGGSNEDLSVFNSEIVVRAIAESSKPIVSAVGHGVDFTLSDFAADKRAVTPSEAAEFVTLDVANIKAHVGLVLNKMRDKTCFRYKSCCESIEKNVKYVSAQTSHKIDVCKTAIKFYLSSMQNKVTSYLQQRKLQLDNTTAKLQSLNPANVLKRGYGYVTSDGKHICSAKQLVKGDNLTVKLQDGSVKAEVTEIL